MGVNKGFISAYQDREVPADYVTAILEEEYLRKMDKFELVYLIGNQKY